MENNHFLCVPKPLKFLKICGNSKKKSFWWGLFFLLPIFFPSYNIFKNIFLPLSHNSCYI